MKKFFIAALAGTLLAAPFASAQDSQDWRHRHGQPQHHSDHGRGPPRGPDRAGWGPHRGHDGPGYYHGYHGSHDRRPGYRRRSDGLWYPAAAFALGAIIGGALNN